MVKTWNLTIYFKNGESKTFDKVTSYEFMAQGAVFIQLPDDISELGDGENEKIIAETKKYWFNFSEIQRFEIDMHTAFEGEMECYKYRKFKSVGINMIHQKISHTEPPSQSEINKVLKNDKVYQVLKSKSERNKNLN